MDYLPENKSNLLEELVDKNPYLALREGINQCHLNSRERKLKLGTTPTFGFECPWIYIKGNGQACHELMHIATHSDFVPSPCLDCWKTVVRPQTLKQLIQLLELMEELQYMSKCGLEERDYVFGYYGGYFYSRSFEDGKARTREVKPLIKERVGDIPVYLKRFCTEFEQKYCPGATETYEPPAEMKILEDRLFHRLDMSLKGECQPDDLKELLVIRWIKKAYSIGDPTALEFNNGKPFTTVQVYDERK